MPLSLAVVQQQHSATLSQCCYLLFRRTQVSTLHTSAKITPRMEKAMITPLAFQEMTVFGGSGTPSAEDTRAGVDACYGSTQVGTQIYGH